MITHSPPRRRGTALLALGAMLAGTALLATPATAAPGAAPVPVEYRVLQDLHTDAVSTFLDDGVLALDSKADVAEGNGTRFSEEEIWFHVDDDSKTTLPAGYEFIAPNGSEVWIAPQSSPGPTQLWPGFSTESVALGAIDNNSTTFTLVGVDGPGDLELFTTGSFGGVTRIWSSDEPNLATLTVGRVHMHANWAFTAAGSYDITVQAAASIGGVQQTDTATYTFVVGALPEDAATTTSLTLSASELVAGDPLSASATVTPSTVQGFVEFRDGETVLGHETVVDGAASLDLDLGVGAHSITSTFVPAVANLADGSVSSAVPATVTDDSGLEFGIRGIEASYAPGDTLDARIVGYTLGENQQFRWIASHADSGTSSWNYATGQTLELPLDASFDGLRFRAQVYDTVARAVIAQSADTELTVVSLVDAPSLIWVDGPSVYLGSAGTATITPPAGLQEGDTIVSAFRQKTAWLQAEYSGTIEGTTLTHTLPFNMVGQVHLRVVRDGLIIAQSDGYTTTHGYREVLIQGAQGIYRAGQTLNVSATVYPMADTLSFEWRYRDGSGTAATTAALPDDNGVFTFTRELSLADDGGDLRLQARFPTAFGFAGTAGTATLQVHVSDAAAGEQLVALDALADHYHQGGTINLHLNADPAPADTDTITWQWRWPNVEWETIPGLDSATETLKAEQALDGVEVRAILSITGTELSYIANPVTIDVDDHGAAPSQKVTLAGLAEQYGVGENVELVASVAPASVIDRWEWVVTRPGEETGTPIEGQTSSTLSVAATEDLDGAQVVARLMLPNGTPYVASAPVTLSVSADVSDPAVERVFGANRWATAVEISKAAYPDGADVVYVSTGVVYPDALAAGPVAAAAGAPLLLVPAGALPDAVRDEIERLGADEIVVVGGQSSVSNAAFVELDALVTSIERIAGSNRYETSRLLAEHAFGDSGAQRAYIATGLNFPDALTAGPAAGANDAPVVLVRGLNDALDAETGALIDELGVETVRVLGHEASVTQGIVDDLTAAVPDTERLAGANRYETARAVNADAFESAGRVFLATGASFPDALAGSAWAAAAGSPLFIVRPTCIPGGVLDDIDALGATTITLLGGEPTLGQEVAALTRCAT